MVSPLILLFVFISFSILLWKFTDKVLGKVKPIRLRLASPILRISPSFVKRHQGARFGSLALELFPATGPVRLCLFPVLNRWKMACKAVARKHRAQKPVDQPAFVTLWRGSLHFCCAKQRLGLT